MATPFSLTAKLNVQLGQTAPAIDELRRKLSGIKVDVDIRVAQGTNQRITNLNKNLPSLERNLLAVAQAAKLATAALGTIGTGANINLNNLSNVKIKLGGIGTAAKSARNDISQIKDEVERFGASSALAFRRYSAFLLVAATFFGSFRTIKFGLTEAFNFQKEIVRLGIVAGKSTQELRGIVNEITRLSTTFGVSSNELAQTSVTLAQAGLTATDTRVALEALAKTSLAPTFGDIATTTDAAIAAMSQFDIKAKDLERTLSKVNAVAAAFAVESDDIAEAIRKSGGTFKVSGGDLDQLIALFTSVRATTRESAESIATGFRTIFARIQRKDTLDFLRNLNIELEEAGKFVGPLEAVRRLNAALKDLPQGDIRLTNISEELGGLRQISRVIPLILQFEKAQQALAVAQAGSNSLAIDSARAQEAFLVKLDKLKESFLELFRVISENKALNFFLDRLLEVGTVLTNVAKLSSTALLALSGFALIKGVQRLPAITRGFRSDPLFGGAGAAPAIGGPSSFDSTIITSQKQAEQISKQILKNLGLSGSFRINSITDEEELRALNFLGTNKEKSRLRGVARPDGAIGLNFGVATGKTLEHEIIHQLDRGAGQSAGISRTGNPGGFLSRNQGSLANLAVTRFAPIVEQELLSEFFNKELKSELHKFTEKQFRQYLTYRLRPEELFVELAQRSDVSTVRKLIGIDKLAPGSNQNAFILNSVLQSALAKPRPNQAKGGDLSQLQRLILDLVGERDAVVGQNSAELRARVLNAITVSRTATQVSNDPIKLQQATNFGKMSSLDQFNSFFRTTSESNFPPVNTFDEFGKVPFGPPSPTRRQRLGNLARRFGGPAALAATVAAPLILESTLGSTETNVGNRKAGAFGSALSSAVVSGGSVGLLSGNPLVGLGVGVLAFITTLKSENDKLRKLEFSETLDTLVTRLRKFNSDPRLREGQFEVTRAIINKINEEAKAASPLKGRFFDPILGLVGAASDPIKERQSFFANQRSQLPELITFRNKIVDNINSLEEFRKQSNNTGAALINLISQVTGLSLNEVEQEIVKDIKARQQSVKTLDAYNLALRESIDAFREVSALAAAATSASEAMQLTNNTVSSLNARLNGTVTGLDTFSFGDAFGRFGQFGATGDINRQLGFLSSNFGPIGQDVAGQGRALEIVARTLPSIFDRSVKEVLPNAVGIDEADGRVFSDITGRIRSELTKGGIGDALAEALSKRFSALAEGQFKDEGEFRAAVAGDSQDVARQVLAKANIDDFAKQLGDFFKEFEGQINLLSQRLNESIKFELDIESRLKDLGEARLNIARTQAEFDGKLLPVSRLNQPFLAQQERLTGGFGIGTNVGAIAGRRNALETNLSVAREDLFKALQTGQGPIDKLRQNVLDLSKELAKADKALENLTDASNLSANAQERLAVVNKEREALTGFGQQFAFGTSEERFTSLRGLALGLEATRTGDLRNIPDEFRPEVGQFFSQFGDVRFGDKFGRDIALDVVKGELDRVIPKNLEGRKEIIDLLSARVTQEQKSLQDQIIDALKIEAQAREALLDKQQSTYEQFIETTKGAFTDFVEKLKQGLRDFGAEENRRIVERAEVGRDTAIRRQNDATNLSRFVGGFENLGNLKQNFGVIEELAKRQADRTALSERFDRVKNVGQLFKKDDIAEFLFADQEGGAIESGAARRKQLGTVREIFSAQANELGIGLDRQKTLFDRLDTAVLDVIRNNRGLPKEQLAQEIDKTIKQALDVAKDSELSSADFNVRIARQQASRLLPGLDRQQIDDLAKNVDALRNQFKAIGDFNVADGLQQFTDAVKTATDNLNKIKADLANREPFARGGVADIFKPKGTDTIPAMLTRGEFVVNAKDTKKNKGLLEAINSGRVQGFASGGLVDYMATGGPVGREAQRARRLAQKKKLFDDTNKRRVARGLPPLPAPPELGGGSNQGLAIAGGRAGQALRGASQRGDVSKGVAELENERLYNLRTNMLNANNQFRSATGRRQLAVPPRFRIGEERNEKQGLANRTQLDKSKSGNRFAPGNQDPVFYLTPDEESSASISNARKNFELASANFADKERLFRSGVSVEDAQKAPANLPEVAAPAQEQIAIDYATQRRAQGLARERLRQEGGLTGGKTAAERAANKERFNQILKEETIKEARRREGVAKGIDGGEQTISEILGLDPNSTIGKLGNRKPKSFADVENFRRSAAEGKFLRESALGENTTTPENIRAAREQFLESGFANAAKAKALREGRESVARQAGIDALGKSKSFRDRERDEADPQGAKARAAANREAALAEKNRNRKYTPPVFSGYGPRQQNRPSRTLPSLDRGERVRNLPDLRGGGNVPDTRTLADDLERRRKLYFAEGGEVGGDSVVGALTPGEFVLNRGAVSRLGLPTLQRFNKGGLVYKQNGGMISGNTNTQGGGSYTAVGFDQASQKAMKDFQTSAMTLTASFAIFSTSIGAFSTVTKTLSDALNKFPRTVELSGKHTVEVVHNGAQIFAAMQPEIKNLIVQETNKAVTNRFKKAFGGEGHVEVQG